jgi:hypothetical protein
MLLTRPGLPIGDSVPAKTATDVLLEATAYPDQPGAVRSTVTLRCAEVARELVVHGRRSARVHGNQITFSAAEAIEPTALVHRNAYGGGIGTARAFPRNPAGKGFLTRDRLADGDIELPLVEEGVPLTPQNLIAAGIPGGAACACNRRSAAADDQHASLHLGLRTPYPMPGDLAARSHVELFKEAPPHSVAASGRTPIEVTGCLPNGQPFRARAPRQPRVTLTVEGQLIETPVRPQTLRIRPEANELSITYGIEHALSRTFLPGVHARIPIAVEIEGSHVAFPTEEPILQKLRRAKLSQEISEKS